MAQEGITQIDVKQVLQQKAPSVAGKIPGFIVNYLIRTIHHDELNDILTRYHDKDGVDFMQELIGYFDLTLELVNEENIPKAREMLANPCCKYAVRIGSRVFVHKELFDEEVKKSAKFQLTM